MNQLKYLLLFIFSVVTGMSSNGQADTYPFEDKNNEYEILLPSSWKHIKAKMIVQFTVEDPAQRKRQLTLERITLHGDNKNWNTQQLGEILLNGIKENEAKGKMKLLGNKKISINGAEWENLLYISNKLRFDAYNIVQNGIRYSFYYIAPENDFEAGQDAANKTIRSFRFKNIHVPATSPIAAPVKKSPVNTPPVVNNIPKDAGITLPANAALPAKPVVADLPVITEKFSCDTTHKPYKYYAFIWESKLDAKNKTGISILGKLPPATPLQAISFYDKKQLNIITGRSQHIDDEGVTYDYTNLYNFPAALDEKYRFGEVKDALMAIRSAQPLEFSILSSKVENNSNLKEKFQQQIKTMINSEAFKAAHRIEDSYYQEEFNKYIRQPLKNIQKINIPGINCYYISLEGDHASFISINDKLYFLSVKIPYDIQIYFYKMNNNYFIAQFNGPTFMGGDFLIYEIRDTGIREEWAFNSNIENSNFDDSPKDRAREKKMRYHPL